jgi:hypothetical protein
VVNLWLTLVEGFFAPLISKILNLISVVILFFNNQETSFKLVLNYFLNQELSFGSNSNSKKQTQFQFGFYKPKLQMIMVLTYQITQHQYKHGIEIAMKTII